MPELFPHFIMDPQAFMQANAFWKALACHEADALGQKGEWERWAQEEEWSYDSSLMDGVVIFTLYSVTQHKGLRVQQSVLGANAEPKPYVSAFMDVAGEGFYERPIPNLFIGVVPTHENLPLIQNLVRHWFRKDVDASVMQNFIETEIYEKRG
jgi:hypothetical protein